MISAPPAIESLAELAVQDTGSSIYNIAARIFPICRSITGNGIRETLSILGQYIPITASEVPTGTAVFDWTVPREWNVRDAYVKDAGGRRVIDFAATNLHVVSYSGPIRAVMPLSELRKHIFTLPDAPELVPYRTSYYKDFWGFCMSHNAFTTLADGDYEVFIDSTLEDGSLTYGEHVHAGQTEGEVLLSAHICHPSLANDNCAGLALLTELARRLAPLRTKYSYRFLFAPGTIGAITWLARNETHVERIRHGLVVSCVGDRGGPSYKRSRRGIGLIDRAMEHVLRHLDLGASVHDFSPYGYDERQFCSPGFNLSVGLFQRSRFGTFPEYHTSGDNLDFISPDHLANSFQIIASAIDILENDRFLFNTNPKCEPQLGRRGLYSEIGGDANAPAKNMAVLWLLSLSDGQHSLLDIADRSGLPFARIRAAAQLLEQHGLLVETSGSPAPSGENVSI
jgi:aminopeptidase-like protein